MSLIVDNDIFEFNLITPTPRQTHFNHNAIQIPAVPYPPEHLSPFDSPDLSASPCSSPSPQTDYQTDYSTTSSLAISPSFSHQDLPSDVDSDFPSSLNFTAPLSLSKPKPGPRSRAEPPPRKGDPSYIPRPENAFILFRKDAVAKMRAAEAEAAQSDPSGDKAKRQRQADMSKCISHMWKSLTSEERSEWDERAARLKREHEAKHPDYRYQPARPGSTNKRAGPGRKARLIRSKTSTADEDEFLRGGLSEELSIVVRPTRAPRRSSVASTASSVSSFASPISLPSIDNFPRSASPYDAPAFVRSAGSRQWVQPPAQDPSPPPSELYFPRSTLPPGLEMFAPQPPMVKEEVRPVSMSQRRSKQSSEDRAAVFVEPITADKNPWTAGGKFPVAPRRGSIRSRPRSQSQPQPIQYQQDTTVEIAQPQFDLDMAWAEEIPEMTASPASAASYGAPWEGDFSVPQSAMVDQQQQIITDGECTSTDLSAWDWGTLFAPLDLSSYIAGQQVIDYADPQQDVSRTFNVVNLDPQGRPRPFF